LVFKALGLDEITDKVIRERSKNVPLSALMVYTSRKGKRASKGDVKERL
jgi:hypothetical protein